MSVNVPPTVWRKTNGLDENQYTGLTFIVDPQANFLVDPNGDFVIDTGIQMNVTPATVWVENDGI